MYMGVWVCGCVGVWVRVCVCACGCVCVCACVRVKKREAQTASLLLRDEIVQPPRPLRTRCFSSARTNQGPSVLASALPQGGQHGASIAQASSLFDDHLTAWLQARNLFSHVQSVFQELAIETLDDLRFAWNDLEDIEVANLMRMGMKKVPAHKLVKFCNEEL